LFVRFLLLLLFAAVFFEMLLDNFLHGLVISSAESSVDNDPLFWSLFLEVDSFSVVCLDSHSTFIFGNNYWLGSGLMVKFIRVKLFTLSGFCWVKLFPTL